MNNEIVERVRRNVATQTPQARESYLKACETHGGDSAEAAAIVRAELQTQPPDAPQNKAVGSPKTK